MTRRVRGLVGVVLILAFLPVYVLIGTALAHASPLEDVAPFIRAVIYGVVAVVWILPVASIIKWIEKPGDRDDVPYRRRAPRR